MDNTAPDINSQPVPPQNQTPAADTPMFMRPTQPQKKSGGKGKSVLLILIIIIILIVGAVAVLKVMGVIKISRSSLPFLNNSSAEVTPSQDNPVASASASPLPTASVSAEPVSALKAQVLNGSGITGQAAKVKAILAGLGFGEITTGNADNTNYASTSAMFNQNVAPDLQGKIITALQKDFPTAATGSTSPATGFDVEIITGKK